VSPGKGIGLNVRQPYTAITQWRNGKLHAITKGTDKGWVLGY
jgi:hypothetical protein